MNWLSRAFERLRGASSDEEVISPTAETTSTKQQSDVLKDLFLDETPPEPKTETATRSENILKQFLDRSFSSKGFNDGYEIHQVEILENNKRKIRSEFRYVLDLLIDDRKREIFSLRNQLVSTDGIAKRIHDQLQLRIEELQMLISQLQRQKELSVEDEGLVMVPIHNYHDGFVKGVQSYLEEKFFASSTGLFT